MVILNNMLNNIILNNNLSLSSLKLYLQQNGPTSLIKIAKDFDETTDQVLNIAQHYIAKNRIYCEKSNPKCGSLCNACFASKTIKMSWVTQ